MIYGKYTARYEHVYNVVEKFRRLELEWYAFIGDKSKLEHEMVLLYRDIRYTPAHQKLIDSYNEKFTTAFDTIRQLSRQKDKDLKLQSSIRL